MRAETVSKRSDESEDTDQKAEQQRADGDFNDDWKLETSSHGSAPRRVMFMRRLRLRHRNRVHAMSARPFRVPTRIAGIVHVIADFHDREHAAHIDRTVGPDAAAHRD